MVYSKNCNNTKIFIKIRMNGGHHLFSSKKKMMKSSFYDDLRPFISLIFSFYDDKFILIKEIKFYYKRTKSLARYRSASIIKACVQIRTAFKDI